VLAVKTRAQQMPAGNGKKRKEKIGNKKQWRKKRRNNPNIQEQEPNASGLSAKTMGDAKYLHSLQDMAGKMENGWREKRHPFPHCRLVTF